MKTATNVVIGGGLYGCMIALQFAARGEKVVLFEREGDLLRRASYNNQARVHGGYHYPRNRVTGRRSRANMARFEREFGFSVSTPAPALYAIARHNSKVTARQFEEFCADIGTPLYQIDRHDTELFDSHLVEAVYRVEEPVFNAAMMREGLRAQLVKHSIDVRMNTSIVSACADAGTIVLAYVNPEGQGSLRATRVFNCTYSGLGGIDFDGVRLKTRLKHEITEMALVEMPAPLRNVAITIMDGDFWSSLPFPDRQLHTLSHVGYTPHISWEDNSRDNVYELLESYRKKNQSRGSRMILDASRYVPSFRLARQHDSLWEVKTVLVKNEADDGRPILLEKHPYLPVWNVLGGKVDNVFDLMDRIDMELSRHASNGHADNLPSLVLG